MSELEYCAFCDGGYAHSGICDKCTTEIGQTGKELADKDRQLAEARAENAELRKILATRVEATRLDEVVDQLAEANRKLAERINDDQKYLIAPLCNAEKALDDCQSELAEARAEIERLKEWEYCMKTQAPYEAAGATWELRHKHDQAVIAERDKLIEQMREALKLALTECRSTHCENKIKAALSAAERGGK